ncbi:glycosyltransferase [Candidatus Parcubacteria bacterium]|nr:MAG: glycosyltransferase [Candidatus Parcubacteria bacterium]
MNIFKLSKTIISHLRAGLEKPYSRLMVMSEGSGWSLDIDAKETADAAKRIGIGSYVVEPRPWKTKQCVHITSQFLFSYPAFTTMSKRMSVDFFHGYSGLQENFEKPLEALLNFPGESLRVRVSNSLTEQWILNAGASKNIIYRIPIGIRIEWFPLTTMLMRQKSRKELDIPEDSFVVGSFQKDGIGWNEGLEPKMIKGPDVFLETLSKAKKYIPNLFVLLSGPARGYIKNGLRKINIPFKHSYPSKYKDISRLYQALDAYLISSRDEGGPKAFLESLASGIPLVSTRVGQVFDLATHGKNALLSDPEDIATLNENLILVSQMNESEKISLIAEGRFIAEKYTHENLDNLWRKIFNEHVVF